MTNISQQIAGYQASAARKRSLVETRWMSTPSLSFRPGLVLLRAQGVALPQEKAGALFVGSLGPKPESSKLRYLQKRSEHGTPHNKAAARDVTAVSIVLGQRMFCNFAGHLELVEWAPVSRMPLVRLDAASL